MTQEDQDKSEELNHLSINYEELVREHGRLTRTLGTDPVQLAVLCETILQCIGDIHRTGVADTNEVSRKANYWHNVRVAHLKGAKVPEEGEMGKSYSTLSGKSPTVEELNKAVGGDTLTLENITARVMHDSSGRIIAFMMGPDSTREEAISFQRLLIEEAKRNSAKAESPDLMSDSLPQTPSAVEWEEQMDLFFEVRNRIVRALTMRNLSVPSHEVDETHTIRLWVETEAFNQAPNVFTVINNILREYPSHEPRVVCWVKHIKIERTEYNSVFTVGG